MKLLSVNVGKPVTVTWRGKRVRSAIFKNPVSGRVHLGTLNLDGDKQADLRVHGGRTKAVYIYPKEHYSFWENEYPQITFTPGYFGENFTTEGFAEDSVHIGDRFAIGNAVITITEPRLPCSKLAVRFGRTDIIKRFLKSMRTGFYASVHREGQVGKDDAIRIVHQDPLQVSVDKIVNLYTGSTSDIGDLEQAVNLKDLPISWKIRFKKKLEKKE